MDAGSIVLSVLSALMLGSAATLIALQVHRSRRVPQVHPASISSIRTRSLDSVRLVAPSLFSAAAAGLLAYAVLGLTVPALVMTALGWGAASAYRGWRRAQRESRLAAALLSAVDLLGQLLPAGHTTRQSLVVLSQSGPAELRPEIAQILARLDDVSIEQALVEAQWRLRQPLFTLIAAALAVGNRSGGRLAPLLQELSRAAHQIDAVQGQLRAEQAQGRLGALVIAIMPLGLLAILHVVNPEYLAPYSSLGGQFLLSGLMAAIVIGYAWMLRILRLPEPDLLPLAPLPGTSGAATSAPGSPQGERAPTRHRIPSRRRRPPAASGGAR
jgi:tight adherence protein B